MRDSSTLKSTLSLHEEVQRLQDEVEYMQTKLLGKEVKKRDKMVGKINKLTLGHQVGVGRRNTFYCVGVVSESIPTVGGQLPT